jgi:oxygen-dependent protoporphyrinogen oxidase
VILAVPAFEAASLLQVVSPAAATALASIEYASVAMLTLAFDDAAVPRRLDGSGHLVPKPVQRDVTAVSWASTKWAHWRRPGQVVLRASVGRWGDTHAYEQHDDDLVDGVLADLSRQLGVSAEPNECRVSRWPRSFPQYLPGHLDRVAAIERQLATDAPGVTVAGAAYRGLGVPACVRQGREWADATMRRLPR